MKYVIFFMMVLLAGCDDSDVVYSADGGDASSDAGSVDTACSETDPCDDPPDNTFCDGDILNYYDADINGTCLEDTCYYALQTEECDYGCDTLDNRAECHDPCDEIICNDYSACYDDSTLNVYEDGECGVFVIDECYYEPYAIICPNGCVVVPDGDDYCQE